MGAVTICQARIELTPMPHPSSSQHLPISHPAQQHLLCLRPQALLNLPNLKRDKAPCQKPNKAPREGTKSTAMLPVATLTLPMSSHLMPTRTKKPTMRQDIVTPHSNQTHCGVLGAPNMVSP